MQEQPRAQRSCHPSNHHGEMETNADCTTAIKLSKITIKVMNSKKGKCGILREQGELENWFQALCRWLFKGQAWPFVPQHWEAETGWRPWEPTRKPLIQKSGLSICDYNPSTGRQRQGTLRAHWEAIWSTWVCGLVRSPLWTRRSHSCKSCMLTWMFSSSRHTSKREKWEINFHTDLLGNIMTVNHFSEMSRIPPEFLLKHCSIYTYM